MPQLPEDIIDRLTQMERRIQQLSTAVNTRPAQNTVTGGGVEITGGGYLTVRPPNGGPALFSVGKWSGDEYGLAMRRQTGELALSLYNGDGTSTSVQPLRIHDIAARELISDDVLSGGLARPWLNMLPPQDSAVARWPQTTATTMTTIAMSYNVVWQPRMRLLMNTRAGSGATGSVRVLVNGSQWGNAVTAGSDFDYSAPVATDFAAVYGTLLKVEVQAQVTSASGTVYANPVLMYGRQS
ncbi:hypothetical protein FSY75_16920 [Streptomyces sp. TR1341]|uniref:hypothetical protein n=1 Tax=Streptomyces sp. TR1341 TaxID=2601266 RepID=UPI00138B17F6|nr:hypothetical protein [Streptomyces sp. TR1341]